MATGADLVASARTRLDWDYEVDEHRLIGDTRTTDCSGFIYLAAKDCGLTIPTVSWTQARWCHAAGTDMISFRSAIAVPGALLFRGDRMGYDGFGSGGHVAMVLGDGVNVIEAEGHARDVLIDPAGGPADWDNAALMPGIDYGAGALPGPSVYAAPLEDESDEETFMLVQPGKKSALPGRLPTARLNVPGRCVDLFNEAAIAYDQGTKTPHQRRWKIGARQGEPNPTLNGVPLGMAALPDETGVVVTMSDGGTFIGKWS